MKKIILISFLVFISIFSKATETKYLNAYFHYATYTTPDNNPYIETYLTIAGNTVIFNEPENNNLQASIEITMLFVQDSIIKEFRKYNLKSPMVPDTIQEFPNFIDLQRIPLPNGIYDFELQIKDNYNEEKIVFKHYDVITINYQPEKINFSGIMLFESFEITEQNNIFTKSGNDIVPFVSDFYPQTIEKIGFYTELYNVDKSIGNDEGFLLRYFIETYQSKKPINEFNFFEKQLAGNVNILMKEFSIVELPSGNYNLVIEARNKQNDLLLTNKLFFQRSNPDVEFKYEDIAAIDIEETFASKITNIDTISEYIRCIRPISDAKEMYYADNQLKKADLKLMQKYFYNFWEKISKENPEQEWKNYLLQVNLINRLYSTQIKKGYETDRGRVYLKYGTPNSLFESKHEPSAYPYEIWHYYKIDNQANKRFVFYNPQLVGNEYILLHSDVNGEITNSSWEYILNYRRQPYDHDRKEGIDHFGGKAKEQFKNY
ncbi:MAG: GWxTD domain-containing protein [Bacteroidales bacterium]|nr:GWxTD domain-containing protein [Bacteroidales bacterium]